MADNRVVVGVFADQRQAEQALHDLYRAGFRDEQIGFIVRDATTSPQGETTEKLETGTETNPTADLVTGGVLGGVVGAVVALLIPGLGPAVVGGILMTIGGVGLGAATGSLIALLTHMGVPEEEADGYNQAFHAGRTIVIVQADERPTEAYTILKRNGDYVSNTDAEMVRTDDPEATVKLEPLESK